MLILGVLLSVPLLVICQQYKYNTVWDINEYPDPWWEYTKCGRSHRSSVCDPNGILTEEKANELDRVIDEVKNDTRCLCYDCVQGQRGYLIRVALMNRMQKLFNLSTTGPNRNLKEAHMYSYLLTQRWKFEGSCNETILILYSLEDNVVYTLTRQHARLKLRDVDIVQVSMDTNHYFNSKDTVGVGLKAMILGYKSFLKGEEYRPYQVEDVKGDNSGSHNSLSLFIVIISIFIMLS